MPLVLLLNVCIVVTAYTALTYTTNTVFGINRIGNTITYLRDGVVVYTSTVASTGNLHYDLAFNNVGGAYSELKVLNGSATIIPAYTDYKLDLNNENVIGHHIDELVSDTDFADIDAALADDAVKKAIAGDFVMIASKIYIEYQLNLQLRYKQ
jgi:hypothetical protein